MKREGVKGLGSNGGFRLVSAQEGCDCEKWLKVLVKRRFYKKPIFIKICRKRLS